MKRILIVGKGSYIGTRLISFAKDNNMPCEINELDVENPSWFANDFSSYDSLVLVAGIAHRRETVENAQLYYEVNRDLAYDIACAAKDAGVPHFIMLSSMSVYGMDEGVITPQTNPNPKSHYGRSKLEGERLVRSLEDDAFKVTILRPPMVYGPGCKGNYKALVNLVLSIPVFPCVANKRSVVYVDNLCAFILLCVARKTDGTFFPQDEQPMVTTEAALRIAEKNGKRLKSSVILGKLVMMGKSSSRIVRKAFGSLTYRETEQHGYRYCVVSQDVALGLSAVPEHMR